MNWMESGMSWVATTFPQVGFAFMILGTIFVLCEIFINATETEEDNKWWKTHIMNGYVGKLVKVVKSFSRIRRK